MSNIFGQLFAGWFCRCKQWNREGRMSCLACGAWKPREEQKS